MRPAGVECRPLMGPRELEACVDLQKEVWGDDFSEVVPPSVLKVAQRIGGVASGAFADGTLVGFVFGITGVEDGRLVHRSDMLAVTAAARRHGLGQRLKWHQRELVLAAGVTHMVWSFDPLQSVNAYLNLAKLGVTAAKYVPDMYGESASPLHQGIGTDRLLAEWELDSARVEGRAAGQTADLSAKDEAEPGLEWGAPAGIPFPGERHLDSGGDWVSVPVPSSIDDLKVRSPDGAIAWRQATREVLSAYLERGYRVKEFRRGDPVSEYLLRRH